MINIKDGLELYRIVKSWTSDYKRWCKESKTKATHEGLVEYIKKANLTCWGIKRVDYEGDTLDMEIGDISVSWDSKLKQSPIILILNVPKSGDYESKQWQVEKDVGGWVEYDTRNGVLSFPFMAC